MNFVIKTGEIAPKIKRLSTIPSNVKAYNASYTSPVCYYRTNPVPDSQVVKSYQKPRFQKERRSHLIKKRLSSITNVSSADNFI